ncbi:Sterigmatocystin 8-O-methyltransferase [Neolecta irregularis DAH-3]|uniref:Sterigmatocystin 8-O-methyltransferase n=1 Tax=Neolecta irregularis (strain DAH-3) TaxID=1198029 RepID=A0A1U7LM64_NEOID|nr:Sterigmatocystin 8-O-methyltransferase [Neolecta irregularis DAH-3]|eukprot:OLL23718.1 Sterigmatocystin 8-O-methyltransferase [Neolecta irregularis DAH-3]
MSYNTKSQKSFLQSLVDIISSSANVIETDRAKRGLRDISLLDPPSSEAVSIPSKEVFEATQSLVGAANMLAAVVSGPEMHLMNLTMGYLDQAALRTVLEGKIADLVPIDGKGISAADISETAGIEKTKLVRVLRGLCNHFVFSEVELEVFAHTNTSMGLLSSSPLYGFCSRASLEFHKALLIPEYSFSFSPEKTPLSLAYGNSGTFFDFINSKGNEYIRERFNRAMQGLGERSLATLPLVYPWNSIKKGGIIVDVGGGTGHACMRLSKTHGDLKYIVQDLPEAIIDARKFWQSESLEALNNGNTILQVHDFFTENPVKQADVYLLRHIIHDWPNDKAIEILKNIRMSMGSDSRILLSENLLKSPARLSDTTAPWPLLGNYGSKFAIHVDLQMLNLINGKERTTSEFRDIFEKSGLKLVEVIESQEEATGVIIVGMPSNSI